MDKHLESWDLKNYKSLFPISYILQFQHSYNDMATVYVITPTYTRSTQLADLTRIKNTLLLVPKVVWIVVEDSYEKSPKLDLFLTSSNINCVHLNEKTLIMEKPRGRVGHKGVEQRNRGLKWIKDNKVKNGVVFFADDDNSYDIRLFEEVTLGNIIQWYKEA